MNSIIKIVFVISLLFIQNSFAEGLKLKNTFLVGVESVPFLPFSNIEKGEYQGVLKEILLEFGKSQGIMFKFIPLPITRLYADFYNGRIDFKLPANPYWQKDIKEKRRLSIHYSNPVVSYTDGVMVPIEKEKTVSIDGLKKLGVVAGFTPWEYLDQIKAKKIVIKENPSIDGLLQQAVMKRIDGAYVNIDVANYYLKLKSSGTSKLKFAKSLPHTKSSYFLASIKHEALIKKFNLFMKKNAAVLLKIHKSFGTSL